MDGRRRTPVVLGFEQKAYDLNERVLELLAEKRISELLAFLLFIIPGTSSDTSSPPSQGWHRVYPPLTVSPSIFSGLRARNHHLRSRRSKEEIGEILIQVETLEAEQRQNQQVYDLLAANSITEEEAAKMLIGKRFAPAAGSE